MKHKTKGIISLFMALCLMLSLGVGALADLNVVDPTPENIPSVTFGDPNTLTNTDPSTDPGADDKENNEPQPGQKSSYTITVNVNPADAGTVRVYGPEVTTKDGKTTAEARTFVFLTVTADDEYTVTASPEDCDVNPVANVKNQFAFFMPEEDVTISVNLTSGEPEGDPAPHTITVSVTPTGSGTVNCPTEAKKGDTVDFTVTPAKGYELVMVQPSAALSAEDITINAETVPIQCSFPMPDDDVTISAIFKVNTDTDSPTLPPAAGLPHDVTVHQTPGGTVTVEGKQLVDNKTTASEDEEIFFIVKPDPGYTVDTWSQKGNGSTVDPVYGEPGKYSFTMGDTDVEITFYFKEDTTQYAINIDKNITNGTVTTNPAGSAVGGKEVKVIAVPEDGYELGSISVTETDGTPGHRQRRPVHHAQLRRQSHGHLHG